MRELINQAFTHIHSISAHVREGHYDLEGPEGELILRNIWDTTIQPGWQITMKMWPDLELLPTRGAPQPGAGAGALPGSFRPTPGMSREAFMAGLRAQHQQQARRTQQPPLGRAMHPPVPPMHGGGHPRPPVPPAGATFGMFPAAGRGAGPGPGVDIVDESGRRHHKKSDKDKKKAALGWLGGRTGSGSKKK